MNNKPASDPASQFELGKSHYENEDYEQAVEYFTEAAKQGHAGAQFYLGECYDCAYGGLKQDRALASELIMMAAQQGLAIAQFTMGCRYCNNGSGVTADAEQAKYWEAKAAQQGYTGKQFQEHYDRQRELQNAARFRKYREKLEKLNLKTFADFESLIIPLMRDAAKLIIERSEMPENPKDTQLKSHFGGQPYFEKGEEWPVTKDGNRLDFVFQFFNTDKHLPENIKLIQFYYDYEESPWFTKDDGWLVKVYEQLDIENIIFIENTDPPRAYCEIEYETIKTLPHEYDLEAVDKNADMLCQILDEEDPYFKIAEKLNVNHDLHSQIGGYPDWLQGSAYPDDTDYIFLFQIDSEGEAGLHWVDCGLVYAFYNPKTKETIFELQCC